jgi:hypothetical protein
MQTHQDDFEEAVDGPRLPQSPRQQEQHGLRLLPPPPAPCTNKNSFLLRLETSADTTVGKDGATSAAARPQPRKDADVTAHSAIIITAPSDSSSGGSNDGNGPVSIYDVLSRKRKYCIIYISAVAAILAPLSTTSEFEFSTVHMCCTAV